MMHCNYYNNSKISSVKQLYHNATIRICFKHHADLLPCTFSENVMPELRVDQLQKRVTRVSLDQMYNYKNISLSASTNFKVNCTKHWNVLPLETKVLPYSSNKHAQIKQFKL